MAYDENDDFASQAPTIIGPAVGAFAITPHDTNDLTKNIRQLTVGTAGVVVYISSRDGQTYTTGSLPAGSYPMFASRIKNTGTTATDLTGWV